MFLVGYRNVAIEQVHNHDSITTKIPPPVNLNQFREMTKGKLNLYNRLTVIYDDTSVTHTMARSQTIKMYHIIAALPTTDAALQHACQNFIGDIITYNSKTIRFRLNRKFYYLALRRNMFFELKYSPAILDSNERRATISRSHQCHLTGRSRGIIISSGATDRFEIRSPCDVANLGLIFNLSEDQARSSVNSMCRKVLIAAESRRLGKNPVLAKYEDVDTDTTDDDEEDDDIEMENESNKRKSVKLDHEDVKKIKLS